MENFDYSDAFGKRGEEGDQEWGHAQAPDRVRDWSGNWEHGRDRFMNRIPFTVDGHGNVWIGHFGGMHDEITGSDPDTPLEAKPFRSKVRGAIYPEGQQWVMVIYTNSGTQMNPAPHGEEGIIGPPGWHEDEEGYGFMDDQGEDTGEVLGVDPEQIKAVVEHKFGRPLVLAEDTGSYADSGWGFGREGKVAAMEDELRPGHRVLWNGAGHTVTNAGQDNMHNRLNPEHMPPEGHVHLRPDAPAASTQDYGHSSVPAPIHELTRLPDYQAGDRVSGSIDDNPYWHGTVVGVSNKDERSRAITDALNEQHGGEEPYDPILNVRWDNRGLDRQHPAALRMVQPAADMPADPEQFPDTLPWDDDEQNYYRNSRTASQDEKWAYLNGSVGFGKHHHQIIEQMARGAGMDDFATRQVANHAMVNRIPANIPHQVAWGHMEDGYPAFWRSNIDRTYVWGVVNQAHEKVNQSYSEAKHPEFNPPKVYPVSDPRWDDGTGIGSGTDGGIQSGDPSQPWSPRTSMARWEDWEHRVEPGRWSGKQPHEMTREEFERDPDTYWHASPIGEMGPGPIHFGSHKAAYEAMTARLVGANASDLKWQPDEGIDALHKLMDTSKHPMYSRPEPWMTNPGFVAVRVAPHHEDDMQDVHELGYPFNGGDMGDEDDPSGDSYANTAIAQPGNRSGYLYRNESEDPGSYCGVVPDKSWLWTHDDFLRNAQSGQRAAGWHFSEINDPRLQELVEKAITEGGFSVNADLSDAPPSGFFTAYAGGQEIPAEQFGPGDIAQIQGQLRPGDLIGAWLDRGTLYLDRSRRFEDVNEALQFGADQGQLSIYDANTGDTIGVPGSGWQPEPSQQPGQALVASVHTSTFMMYPGDQNVLQRERRHITPDPNRSWSGYQGAHRFLSDGQHLMIEPEEVNGGSHGGGHSSMIHAWSPANGFPRDPDYTPSKNRIMRGWLVPTADQSGYGLAVHEMGLGASEQAVEGARQAAEQHLGQPIHTTTLGELHSSRYAIQPGGGGMVDEPTETPADPANFDFGNTALQAPAPATTLRQRLEQQRR